MDEPGAKRFVISKMIAKLTWTFTRSRESLGKALGPHDNGRDDRRALLAIQAPCWPPYGAAHDSLQQPARANRHKSVSQRQDHRDRDPAQLFIHGLVASITRRASSIDSQIRRKQVAPRAHRNGLQNQSRRCDSASGFGCCGRQFEMLCGIEARPCTRPAHALEGSKGPRLAVYGCIGHRRGSNAGESSPLDVPPPSPPSHRSKRPDQPTELLGSGSQSRHRSSHIEVQRSLTDDHTASD